MAVTICSSSTTRNEIRKVEWPDFAILLPDLVGFVRYLVTKSTTSGHSEGFKEIGVKSRSANSASKLNFSTLIVSIPMILLSISQRMNWRSYPTLRIQNAIECLKEIKVYYPTVWSEKIYLKFHKNSYHWGWGGVRINKGPFTLQSIGKVFEISVDDPLEKG